MKDKKLDSIMEILREIGKTDGKENVILSPVSVLLLLTVLAVSAKGETREEIQKAIYGDDYAAMLSDYSDLQKQITADSSLTSANAVCVNSGLKNTIVPSIRESLSVLTGELFTEEDIVGAVNAWVKEKTNGMICGVLDESDKDALVCFLNAVSFSGKWADEYEETDLFPGEFHPFIEETSSPSDSETGATGSPAPAENSETSATESPAHAENVTMLHSYEHSFYEDAMVTGFVKEYDNAFAFLGLLPKKEGKEFLNEAIAQIDFPALIKRLKYRSVEVTLPEFAASYQVEMENLCGQLGIEKAFSNEADFGALSTAKLIVDKVIHKAKITVDRHGTKAAAVTAAVAVGCAFEEPVSLTFDRPFAYAILHKATGIPVFFGVQTHIEEK